MLRIPSILTDLVFVFTPTDLDSPAKPGKSKAASALDNLMGKQSKSSTPDTKKTKPATLDEFMAKVSTTRKTSPQSGNGSLTFKLGLNNIHLLCMMNW